LSIHLFIVFVELQRAIWSKWRLEVKSLLNTVRLTRFICLAKVFILPKNISIQFFIFLGGFVMQKTIWLQLRHLTEARRRMLAVVQLCTKEPRLVSITSGMTKTSVFKVVFY
jgi:hypothetical protein